MSAPTKTRRTNKMVQITVEGKEPALFLVPKQTAETIKHLLESHRLDDFIPAEVVFKDLYAKYGKAGVTLRGFRYREELTQVELAKKLNCPQSWISGWESGKRPLGKKMAQKLAKFFGTDYRVFL